MEWFYKKDGQQIGPIGPVQFQELVILGIINSSTPVWKEGMEDWQPYGQLQVAASSLFGAGMLAACPLCGRRFPKNDMFQHEKVWVCTDCKPAYLEKLEKEKIAGVWKEDRCLVVRSESKFPQRCFKCDKGTGGLTLIKKYYFPNPFRPLCIEVPLCFEHIKKRRLFITLSLTLFLVGIIIAVAGWWMSNYLILSIGIGDSVTGILVLRIALVNLTKVRREGDFVWLKGASKDFLTHFSEWNP
jgi:hypothetical protein